MHQHPLAALQGVVNFGFFRFNKSYVPSFAESGQIQLHQELHAMMLYEGNRFVLVVTNNQIVRKKIKMQKEGNRFVFVAINKADKMKILTSFTILRSGTECIMLTVSLLGISSSSKTIPQSQQILPIRAG